MTPQDFNDVRLGLEQSSDSLRVPAELHQLSMRADAAIREAEWPLALQLSLDELAASRALEGARERRVHKGHAYYNLGVITFAEDPVSARRYFHAAYVEDIRTWPAKRPTGAHAGSVLFSLYGEPRYYLASLASAARSSAADTMEVVSRWEELRTPPEIAFSIPPAGSLQGAVLDQVPTQERVFVGGSYAPSLERIYDVRDVVSEAGLTPVIVREFADIPGERPRLKSFRLMDKCGLYIFEGTNAGGWDFELEHLFNARPDAQTLLVYGADRHDKDHPALMAPDAEDMPNLVKQPYGTTGDRRYAVLRWLVAIPSGVLLRQSHGLPLHGSNSRFVVVPSGTQLAGQPLPGTATRLVDE